MKRREFIKTSALGLMAGMDGSQRLLAGTGAAAEVRGTVLGGTQPLAGVRVSDGYRVVSTDASGEFSIRVDGDSGPFLFMVIPSGWWADQFYVPVASAMRQAPVFRLVAGRRNDQYTAVYLTDIHLGEGHAERSYSRFEASIDEINDLDPLPAFCWAGGDITLQGGKGGRYVELMSRLKMPVRNAVGNHEMLVREPDPRLKFQQLFGPTYYSFDVGRIHYVVLDGCRVSREAEGYKNVQGLLSRRELHWLEEDLRRVPDGVATVASIHIPLVSDYPQRRGTTADQVPWWIVRNADEAIDLLARHGVSLVLQGHLHENQRLVRSGTEFVETVSICGRWWKTPEGTREHGVSGEPRGYRILRVDGSSIAHIYRSSAESRVDAVGEIVGSPARLPAGREAVLPVNIFDPAPEVTVSASIDDGPLERLVPGAAARYHEDLQPAHHWEWVIPGTALTRGTHALRVQVREPGQPPSHFSHTVDV